MFFLQSSNFDQVAGNVALFIIMGSTIALFIFAFFYNMYSKKIDYKRLKELHLDREAKQKQWTNFITALESITEPSCRCNVPTYRLFEIYQDDSLEYRCLTCSKKGRHTALKLQKALQQYEQTPNTVSVILKDTMSFYSEVNRIISEHKITYKNIELNIQNVNRGPWYRGVHFIPNKITELHDAKRSRNITSRVKQFVFERDGGKCTKCGSETDLEFDHIIPFSKGGSNGPKNVQLLCRSCNSDKRAKII